MKPYEDGYFDREVCKPFFMEGSRDVSVLLIHGFTGSVSHMRPLGERLHELGYTVKGINLPGHATSERDMAKADWQKWLSSAKAATQELAKRGGRVAVGGLSMGGVLSLLVAEQLKVDAVITMSAPMAVQNKLMGLASILSPFYPRVAWKTPMERHKQLDQNYDFGYSGFPTKRAADLNKLIKLARGDLFAITCPLLAIQSADDETVWQGSAEYIVDNVSSSDKRVLMLHGVPHVITISKELPAIVSAIDELLTGLE